MHIVVNDGPSRDCVTEGSRAQLAGESGFKAARGKSWSVTARSGLPTAVTSRDLQGTQACQAATDSPSRGPACGDCEIIKKLSRGHVTFCCELFHARDMALAS